MSRPKMWRLLLIGAIICASIPADAIKCYTCTYNNRDSNLNEECITNPEDVAQSAITDCDKKYCTSRRTERVETKDTVESIHRSCADSYTFKNKVEIDPYYRTHYIACSTDLCNGGDGKVADTSRDLDDGDAILLIVPGIQNGNALKVSYYLIFLILVPNIFKFIVALI